MRFRFSLAAILLLLTCALAAVTAQDGVTRLPSPKDFGPDKCIAVATVYGDKTNHQQVYWNSSANAFLLPVAPDTKSVKLIIIRAGYKTIRKEFQKSELSLNKYYKPKFEKLPVTTLSVRVTNADGKPAQKRMIHLSKSYDESEYLGDLGPESYGRNGLEIGYATTDENGVAKFEVPVADPDQPDGFGVGLVADEGDKHSFFLEPNYIPSKSVYPTPIDLKIVQQPTLSGKVERPFLERNNVTTGLGMIATNPGGKRYRVHIMAESPVTGLFYAMGVELDGSFKGKPQAGTYNLTMLVTDSRGTVEQSIPIEKGITLGNGEDKVVEIK